MKVLFVGSGLSAQQARSDKYHDHIKVCLNNAWRIYEGGAFDYWIHPTDFPQENYPLHVNYKKEISYKDYAAVLDDGASRLGIIDVTGFELEKRIGYTSFFQGLYWIMLTLSPDRIGLLGFDHDYNKNKIDKWMSDDKPNIQNHFNNKTEKTIKEWSDNYFQGFETDFFYGHGTPDPMRYGPEYIERKMILAQEKAKILGISIVNYSDRQSPYTVFEHYSL
ncbi:hypothetical protein [Serratia proteamaculans]